MVLVYEYRTLVRHVLLSFSAPADELRHPSIKAWDYLRTTLCVLFTSTHLMVLSPDGQVLSWYVSGSLFGPAVVCDRVLVQSSPYYLLPIYAGVGKVGRISLLRRAWISAISLCRKAK
ncbi:unnamed protein product [Protopolystoma xenopodis]|uniref:Uncharacterized protein n=1 Tax=Protopolystoma xenopodis TaxID=117903 RepID=A0A3S5AA84_9PLAT|nr:unnamed protein product [Protopolystoma xenopodis]